MRTIAVIGAGQAGLSLASVLISKGYEVTLFNNRSSEQIRDGKIMSSQGMFNTALQLERTWGLNFWDTQYPENNSVSFVITTPDTTQKAIEWKGKVNHFFQSVDQRLKFSNWMNEYEKNGGNLVIQHVGLKELNSIAKQHELTIIAGGNNEISECFLRDNNRSVFTQPMRVLSCLYVHGMTPIENTPGICVNVIPGIGEYFTTPGKTLTGNCEMMLFEGVPNGAFDCWDDISSPTQQLEKAYTLLKKYIPWEAERCHNLELTDQHATLLGRYAPIVRHPTFKLDCGKSVLGIADTVVLNDPIAGQGANNATKCVKVYLDSIISHGKNSFDETWMKTTFEQYWSQYAHAATQWSNMLLLPPPPHVIDLFTSASQLPALADTLANAFDNPASLLPWITDPIQTKSIVAEFEAKE